MRFWLVWLTALTVGCTGDDTKTDADPLVPAADGGAPEPDAPMARGDKPAGAACASGAECAGGSCLGVSGQPYDGNPRFAGGYCSATGCTPNTQEGCGPDEFCVEADDQVHGGYCVELCSKADGLTCEREDHVCIGLGIFGGCYQKGIVECDVQQETGCQASELCVRIGYEDKSLGKCETKCDPLHDTTCRADQACYYIRTYNDSFCGTPGLAQPEESCTCDKCCVEGYTCLADPDGRGKHCKKYCTVANPTECGAGDSCVPIEQSSTGSYVSPWGGCVAPGSAGT